MQKDKHKVSFQEAIKIKDAILNMPQLKPAKTIAAR